MAETKIGRFNRLVREFFPNIHPKVVISADGSPAIEIDCDVREKRAGKLFDEVYEAPQRIATKRDRNFIVVLDEFQEIANLNGEMVEKGMRACLLQSGIRYPGIRRDYSLQSPLRAVKTYSPVII